MLDGGLRPIFREKLRAGFDWQSVETGGTGMGCPDSNFCARVTRRETVPLYAIGIPEPLMVQIDTEYESGVEGWIEFKQTSGWACTLRPEQVGWLVRRHMHGGRVFVATRRWHDGGPRLGAPVDELWVHSGEHARELKTGGLTAAPHLFRQDGGPSRWNWDVVREVLTR